MLNFDILNKKINNIEEVKIKDTFVTLGEGLYFVHGVLYEPVEFSKNSNIGVIIVHSDLDYSTFKIAPELAKRGFRTIGGQVLNSKSSLDKKILDIKKYVEFFRAYEGIEKVILMGHSGGATLMSAYQAIAEKGSSIFKKDKMLIKCSIDETLPAADGIMFLDSNWGNGAMTLISMDPSVINEGDGVNLNSEYDIFSEKNGFRKEGAIYSTEFLKKYFLAQSKRNNKVVKKALERLNLIESGQGNYLDDEPFIITAGEQFAPCNKLIPQDIKLLSHTREEHILINKKGETKKIINCVRKPHFDKNITHSIQSCLMGTVKDYLTNRAVLADDNYEILEDRITGIKWEETYNCTPGNVKYIDSPMLIMGMTGSYEYLASEEIYINASSKDKELYFVEGASHNFSIQKDTENVPGEYGDTAKITFDKVSKWLEAKFIK